uniref:Pre-mRNA-splicing regulator WTAP n=1 Tax=Aceria tosichella TaxID=561515 RepID=A0A6G1SC79_9ACAR
MSSSSNQLARRVHLTRDHLADLDKEQLATKWVQQEAYINQLENAVEELSKQADSLQHELQSNETKYKKRLHNICMKLTLRDRKINQLQEKLDLITQNQLPTPYQLESTLIDPALNMMFEKMKSEMEAAKVKVEEMQNELSAWKFTPDSTTGKRLMAKCRLLHNENEELGKEMSTGWVAQLTGNLALQKKFSEEMKKSQSELDEFLLELEEEVEGMQNTIYYLQQRLRELKEEKRTAVDANAIEAATTEEADNDVVKSEPSDPTDHDTSEQIIKTEIKQEVD